MVVHKMVLHENTKSFKLWCHFGAAWRSHWIHSWDLHNSNSVTTCWHSKEPTVASDVLLSATSALNKLIVRSIQKMQRNSHHNWMISLQRNRNEKPKVYIYISDIATNDNVIPWDFFVWKSPRPWHKHRLESAVVLVFWHRRSSLPVTCWRSDRSFCETTHPGTQRQN